MKIGKVMAVADARRKADCLEKETILLVDIEGSTVAVLDKTGAKPDDQVLLVLGHAASRYSMDAPADAVAVAVMKPQNP